VTPLEARFAKAVAALADYPEPVVARFSTLTFIRDQGPRFGVPPKAQLLREIPSLSFDQQHVARDLLTNAANSLKGPTDV